MHDIDGGRLHQKGSVWRLLGHGLLGYWVPLIWSKHATPRLQIVLHDKYPKILLAMNKWLSGCRQARLRAVLPPVYKLLRHGDGLRPNRPFNRRWTGGVVMTRW